MSTFPSEFIDGHVIVQINHAKFLIDTGSSLSFGNVSTVSINAKDFALQKSLVGMNIETINSLSGLQIDGLMGMNILQHFDLRITTTTTYFSSTPFTYAEQSIHWPIPQSIMTIPLVQIGLAGENHLVYFDTGAKISYLHEDLLQGHESIGEIEDFYPSLGKFTVNTYRVSINIDGQHTETMTFGILPPLLKSLLYLGNVKGIIGSELLRKYNIVLSNLTNKIILENKI